MHSAYQSYQHAVSAKRILNGVMVGVVGLVVVAAWLLIR